MIKITHFDTGHNANEVDISGFRVFISYFTVVGFWGVQGKVARINTFSKTTGQHYHMFGLDKARQLPEEEFEYEYNLEASKAFVQIAAGCRDKAKEAKRKAGDAKKRAEALAKEQTKEKELQKQKKHNEEMARRKKVAEIKQQVFSKARAKGPAYLIVAEEIAKGGVKEKVCDRARLALLKLASHTRVHGPPDAIVRLAYTEVSTWIEDLRKQAGV